MRYTLLKNAVLPYWILQDGMEELYRATIDSVQWIEIFEHKNLKTLTELVHTVHHAPYATYFHLIELYLHTISFYNVMSLYLLYYIYIYIFVLVITMNVVRNE